MIEHQSTINENMPFRLLEYVTRIYEGLVPQRARYLKNRIQIPTPEFYVFYNGVDKYPDEKILRLSDSFLIYENRDTGYPQLELSVRVINIGPGQTLKFQNGCDILRQYCAFIEIVRKYAVPGNPESYKQAIQDAIHKGFLKDYLIKNSTEVINMFLAEYDYETDIAVQREEAREEGIAQGIMETAQKMLALGLDADIIQKTTGLKLEQIQALVNK